MATLRMLVVRETLDFFTGQMNPFMIEVQL
jgi:hypothetical protein